LRIKSFIYKKLSSIYYEFMTIKRQRYIQNLVNNGLSLGKNVNIIDTFFFDPSHCFLISIGDNCTICPNVRLISHDASTKKFLGYTKIGRIDIRENSFIGDSVIVLPNVEIGPNSIIGAGSVVTRNVPPGTVAAGNPAKVITSIASYLNKIKIISAGNIIFSSEYNIENLDNEKRIEIINSIGNSIGFII
jgi:maltose O-acetyltransferase